MAENAAFAGLGAGLGVVGRIVGPRLLQLGVSGRIPKVVVNVAHAASTAYLSVPVQKAAQAVEQAILSGKYRVVWEDSQTLLRGEVVVDRVRAGFKGKVIEGTARVGTMFDIKGTP